MSTNAQLFIALGVLLAMSAFFSSSETALMRLNRYRIRTLAANGHLGARMAEKLLARPDRLIGFILAGNNAVNVAATTITAVLAVRIGGEGAETIGGFILLIVLLIFAEVAPKTVAALYPERIAFPASIIYYPLIIVFYPLVRLVNAVANGILRVFGIRVAADDLDALTRDELHAVVSASGEALPRARRIMLLRVLELQEVTVEDIMVSRQEIIGINLDDDWQDILRQLREAQHTRLPVYRDELDNIVGVLHLRRIVHRLAAGDLDAAALERALLPAYFVPEDTPLNKQLLNFKAARERMGLVVDEYGDLQGLVTIDDLLEEIVGEYTTDPLPGNETVQRQDDGSYLVNGSANIRALNRSMNWELPVDGAKTINGVILETIENIPAAGDRFEIAGYPMRVLSSTDSAVQTVLIGERVTDSDDDSSPHTAEHPTP